MKKTILITFLSLFSLISFAQTITYTDLIKGTEDYEKFRELLLSKNYMIESHDINEKGFTTDVFFPIELSNKIKEHRVAMTYKTNMKPAYININSCNKYLEKFKALQKNIKANFSLDKTYFNKDANNYTTRYSNGKTYFTVGNYLDSNNSFQCIQITCSKKF
jgi:hypothetical protein